MTTVSGTKSMLAGAICPECKLHRGHKAICSKARGDDFRMFQAGDEDYSIEAYREFIRAKVLLSEEFGFEIEDSEIHPSLKPHQRVSVRYGVRGGRRAYFMSFGLGKTRIQLETLRIILKHVGGGRALLVAPLGVRQEFESEARELGTKITFIRENSEVAGDGIYLTNYESVREGKLSPSHFVAASLDECDILAGFGGVKTFREFMREFECVKYRFVATATPDPNEYIELLAFAAFLGILDVSAGKTRFFKRDSTKADHLTIHPHKEREWFMWLSTWALFLQTPSDLGEEFSDDGYIQPPLDIRFHELAVDHAGAKPERDGQGRMYRNAAHGLSEAATEKRDTLDIRLAEMKRIVDDEPDEHFILWHDLEDERRAIKRLIPEAVDVFGMQRASRKGTEDLERALGDFSEGRIKYLAAKPKMFSAGCNFQKHCARAIFCGIGYSFRQLIQAIHRIYRFLQSRTVVIHLIYAESEKNVLDTLMEKWERYKQQCLQMSAVIREYGLAREAMKAALTRSIDVQRIESRGPNHLIVNNDCVEELHRMEADSVDLILSSPPFSHQYEYSASYMDMGHSDSNEHFWRQMDFMIAQLYRVLRPGRVACMHVKDRIIPGGISGLGFQTIYPFHADTIKNFNKHGFALTGIKTVVTDVVRENAQTYRLGWSEQCKDASKMGYGLPEYLVFFRKPPTDRINSYGDVPVQKNKPECIAEDGAIVPFDRNLPIKHGSGYSRSRWQVDAHGYMRSDGNRKLVPEDFDGLSHAQIFKLFRKHQLSDVYNFEQHVRLGEELEAKGILPVTFMLLQPQSWHPDVWTDITRMRTLNSSQAQKGKEMHLCIARGSLVLTDSGFKPIEEVLVGDKVLTHKGRWRAVVATKNTGVRPIVRLNAQGTPGLGLTPDHELWARVVGKAVWARAHSRAFARDVVPVWARADAMVGSYVNLKLPPEESSDLSPSDLWILGRWLADGHIGVRGDYWISVGRDKLENFEQIVGDQAGTRSNGTSVQIRLKRLSRKLRDAIDMCGKGASRKQVPVFALALPAKQSKAVLDGYLSGDGYYMAARNRWVASSVSRKLLLGLAMLAQRAYRSVASVYAGREAGTMMIQGRSVQTLQDWVLCFDIPNEARKNGLPFLLEDGAWKKVRGAAIQDEKVETWCLKVDEDESFTVEGCIVKNCAMQLDLVDRVIAQMSMPGETILDPFAGIGTVPSRAVKLGRKGVGIELSTSYYFDAAMYCAAEEEKRATPTLFDLLEAEEAGMIPEEAEAVR